MKSKKITSADVSHGEEGRFYICGKFHGRLVNSCLVTFKPAAMCRLVREAVQPLCIKGAVVSHVQM